MTKEELIQKPQNLKPHVVLLGAGASRAAFPHGDRNRKILPIMNDLIKLLSLDDLFVKYGIKTLDNFEDVYSGITNTNLKQQLENKIHEYFASLELPDEVTDYDRLLLSLRNKDAIFTFNWDPFLFDAYSRNIGVASLPQIFFLHGNVRVGACSDHYQWGRSIGRCEVCNKIYDVLPLLYPIQQKNYNDSHLYTRTCWNAAKEWFRDAFTITIFGYGAPSSDIEAVALLKQAWFAGSARTMEHIEIIDIDSTSNLVNKWGAFTPTHHYHHHKSFKESRLYNLPRRSCESLLYPMTKGIPCEAFPMSNNKNLDEFRESIKEIAKNEM